jgi:hypothetical protein
LIKATTQAIAFMIRKEKDFAKEFSEEKMKNNDTYKKYLLKMNERYPY